MSINRSGTPTKIKCYSTESDMQAQASGDLSLTYLIECGVFTQPFEPNTLQNIEIFTDDVGNLHGLFVPK